MSENEYRHWAEDIATLAVNNFGEEHIVCAGWSPSGEYHIGNSREAVTCNAINRSIRAQGQQSKFVFVIDDFDPLDKIPQDLKMYSKELRPYLGHPINKIPDFTGTYDSYAEYFAAGALKAMEDFAFDVEFVYSSENYAQGKYDKYLDHYLTSKSQLDQLFEEISGSALRSFVSVICQNCGNMKTPVVEKIEDGNIYYQCLSEKMYRGCDEKGILPISSHQWKLKWRLDWPARQTFLGVTVEPSGKDHSMAGGSVDTAIAIHQQILKHDPPILERFGFITVMGGKKASGSKGGVLPASKLSDIMPASAYLYLVYRSDLMRDIEFNPNSSQYAQLLDEFDDARRMKMGVIFEGREKEVSKLSTAADLAMFENERGFIPAAIGFEELTLVYQTSLKDTNKTIEKFEKMGKIDSPDARTDLERRLTLADQWLTDMAPESMKIEFLETPPDNIADFWSLSVLSTWKTALHDVDDDTTPDDFTRYLRSAAEINDLKPKEYYLPFYQLVSGKSSGPNASNLVLALGKDYLTDQLLKIEELLS